MRFAQFSKDSDDLSVTISMGENCQKSGAKLAQGAIYEKIMSLHSKIQNETLNCKIQQKSPGGIKSGLQVIENRSSSSSHGLHPLAGSSIRSSNTRSTDFKASNAQICKWLIKHPHSYTSSCDHNSVPHKTR